ncbi:MAG: putative transposase [Pseudonocardiales bacterium]|nr:putative transposase [Pseudonocardiales bacterium]
MVALGIDIDGVKHPLALVEGSTENATLVTELLVGLRERGLDVTHPILTVLDGSKALRRAILDVFDQPVITRCQLHYADIRIMPIWSRSALVKPDLGADTRAGRERINPACQPAVIRRRNSARRTRCRAASAFPFAGIRCAVDVSVPAPPRPRPDPRPVVSCGYHRD